MKKTTIIIATLAATLISANAATIGFDTLTADSGSYSDNYYFQVNGSGLSEGFATLYAFTTAPTDVSSLLTNGTSGALDTIVFNTTAGNVIGDSLWASSFSFANDGTYTGSDLYIVFGDGTDLASSSYVAMLDIVASPTNADTPTPYSDYSFLRTTESVVIGDTFAGTADYTAIGGSASESVTILNFSAVPEPSSTLLVGLAGLGALLRRRRA
ncbi:MAG: PEP-CTERM sorting domain-containing protein [Akkermansiaceae bacterium]